MLSIFWYNAADIFGHCVSSGIRTMHKKNTSISFFKPEKRNRPRNSRYEAHKITIQTNQIKTAFSKNINLNT